MKQTIRIPLIVLVTVGVMLRLSLLAPGTAAQSNIIDQITENIGQAQGRETGGGAGCATIENVSAPVRAGSRAFRHFIKNCGDRSELTGIKTDIGKTYWYGWSVYVPSNWQATSKSNIVNQWAAYPAVPGRQGNFPCGGNGHKITFGGGTTLRYDLQHDSSSGDKCDQYNLLNISEMRNKWTDFVMHVKWTGNADGFLRLSYRVGGGAWVTNKINYTGATWWNDEGRGPYFKMGYYIGQGERGWTPSSVTMYTDEYRLGSASATFNEVAPGGNSTPTPTPTPNPTPTATPSTTIINEGFSQAADINFINVLGGGVWQVLDGKLTLTNPASSSASAGNANLAVYRTNIPSVEFTLTTEATVTATASNWNDFSIVFGFEDINNYYYASFNESNDANTRGIFRVSNSLVTQLADISEPIVAGQAYAIKIERQSSQIKAYLNNQQVATAADSGLTSGLVGFGTRNDAATFDNLKVVR